MTASDMAWRDGATRFTYHGGNLAAARERFPDAPEPWIDLSTGINGRPYPIGPLDPSLFERLPETSALALLEAVAARAYRARPEAVIAAPGTQALIQWLPALFPAETVGVLGYTYAEHAGAWRRSGARVTTVEGVEDLAGFDVAVLVNPNNPDGRLVECGHLARLAETLAAGGRMLVVDEAFADLLPPEASLVPRLPKARTLVLRSFGKSFGLAGLRLGFAVASSDLCPALRQALGPWAVSGPAISVGTRALADDAWRVATVSRLQAEVARLDRLLTDAGATVVGGTPLFRLAEVHHGGRWFDRLGGAGILVRPFAERPRWLRFGLPTHEWQWTRLRHALDELRGLDHTLRGGVVPDECGGTAR